MLLYDIEIVNAIPDKKKARIPNIQYCSGWKDYDNMGIACICCYSYLTERYHVYLEDNFDLFVNMMRTHHTIVGYNNKNFDDNILMAEFKKRGMMATKCLLEKKSKDLLEEIKNVIGPPPSGQKFHKGLSLNSLAAHNLKNENKTGDGAIAPMLWQQGYFGTVIDYCINDVRLLKLLIDTINYNKSFINPENYSKYEINLDFTLQPPVKENLFD